MDMCSGLEVNKNANSQINLIFVGAFHPKSTVQPSKKANSQQLCSVKQTQISH